MEIWEDDNVIFDGKVVRLRTGSVLLDNGDKAYREVVEHPGGVCVLPYTGADFVLVRQYRIALQRYVVEAPAGKLEPNETPEACAIKELHEETGYRAGKLVSLGKIFPTVGFCNEIIHLFLAPGLTDIGQNLEPEERIEMMVMPTLETRRQLQKNAFSDAKTNVILHRALHYLDIEV